MSALAAGIARFWAVLRAILGDDAYERYVAHRAARHPGEPMLDRDTFFRDQRARRYRQASRCC